MAFIKIAGAILFRYYGRKMIVCNVMLCFAVNKSESIVSIDNVVV